MAASAGGHLISVASLREIVKGDENEDDTRLLMVGLPGAGKTTILTRISKKDGKMHDVGNQKFRVRKLVTEGLNVTVWNVGEGQYVDPYWADYYADRVVGILFVVDSADTPESIAAAKVQLFEMLKNERLAKVPIAIMCNKGDKDGALSVVKCSELLELHDVKHPHKSFKTTTVNDEGIQAALEWVVGQKFTR